MEQTPLHPGAPWEACQRCNRVLCGQSLISDRSKCGRRAAPARQSAHTGMRACRMSSCDCFRMCAPHVCVDRCGHKTKTFERDESLAVWPQPPGPADAGRDVELVGRFGLRPQPAHTPTSALVRCTCSHVTDTPCTACLLRTDVALCDECARKRLVR